MLFLVKVDLGDLPLGVSLRCGQKSLLQDPGPLFGLRFTYRAYPEPRIGDVIVEKLQMSTCPG
jgi:hypothetical protein